MRDREAIRQRLLAGLLLCAVVPALAQFDDGARYAFVASKAASEIIVIDLSERRSVHTIQLPDAPDSVHASEALKALIVGHESASKLTLIDLSNAALDQYAYPLTIRPQEVLVSPIGETVAVFDRDAGRLEVHAIRRKEVLLAVDGVQTGTELTFAADGASVYWVEQGTGTLQNVDLWSARRSLRLAADGAELSSMSRSVDGSTGFLSNRASGEVFSVGLRNLQLLRSSYAGRSPGRPWGTADGQYMLIPNAEGTVTAISTVSGDVVYTAKTVANPISINPGWIDTTAAIIGADGDLLFMNIADGAVLSRTRLAQAPQAGVVTSDSRTLLVPSRQSGALWFFDMQKRVQVSLIDALPNDIGPAALAISNNLCH